MSLSRIFLFIFIVLILSAESFAKQPVVGRRAAAQYFQEDVEPSRKVANDEASGTSGDSLLMLHFGSYLSSESYKWKGSDKRTAVGKASYGFTYLFDEWNSIDVNLRVDFNEYKLDDTRAFKMSVMPLWTLPLAADRFPLYFGLGAGLGVFFQQVEEESSLSFDYQLVLGARFFDLIENGGLFIEYGLKNHLHLLSDGQVNGSVFSAGALFTF